MRQYYSHGKLLLTGEYAILDGALGLALPSQLGQSLACEKSDKNGFFWRSLDEQKKTWFEGTFTLDSEKRIQITSLSPHTRSSKETATLLASILEEAINLNPSFEGSLSGQAITTHLEFNRAWGLGSSSTLINNISKWAEVDPYALLSRTMGGSGYDIACADAKGPILYHLEEGRPVIEKVLFQPSFTRDLYFVYLNKKRKSADAIHQYRNIQATSAELIAHVSSLTRQLLACKELTFFEDLLNEHETLLSRALKIPTIRETLFSDYPGTIKSLGAWGGDFVLATSQTDPRDYFKKKGFTVVIPYTDLIL